MNILFVSQLYPSRAMPQQGLFVRSQALELRKMGHDVKMLAPIPWAPLPMRVRAKWRSYAATPKQYDDGGLPVRRPRYPSIPGERDLSFKHVYYAEAIRSDVEAFLRGGGQVIHAHGGIPDGRALLRLRPKVPVVVTVHGRDVQDLAQRGDRLRARVVETLKGASEVVYISRKLQSMGLELVGEHPCRVIYSGVEPVAAAVRSRPDVFTISCVARLIPTKGIDVLLRAFARLRQMGTTARLRIVGEGPQRVALERLSAELGLTDAVEFLGQRPHVESMTVIAQSSVFVLPSFVEGMGIVYLEAMSLGVAAAGIAGQGISEIIEDGANGFLVPPQDEAALANLLERLHRDAELCDRIGMAGRRTLAEMGLDSWCGNAERHIELYSRLTAGRMG